MIRKLAAVLAVLALAAAASVTALAATTAPKRVTVSTPAKDLYKINRYSAFGLRWNKDVYTIRSGGTLSFKNLQSDDPHTFSVLRRSQLPRTTRQLDACNTTLPALPKLAICRSLLLAHTITPNGPAHPVLNAGKPGIDKPGDSIFIPPKGAPQPRVKVTAKPGTTLYFFCLVHPWMQAKLRVVK